MGFKILFVKDMDSIKRFLIKINQFHRIFGNKPEIAEVFKPIKRGTISGRFSNNDIIKLINLFQKFQDTFERINMSRSKLNINIYIIRFQNNAAFTYCFSYFL